MTLPPVIDPPDLNTETNCLRAIYAAITGLSEVSLDAATEAKQDDILTAIGGLVTEVTGGAILTALAGKATEAKQDGIISALAAQATAAKQDDILTAIGGLATETTLDALITATEANAPITGFATEAKQDDIVAALGGDLTTLDGGPAWTTLWGVTGVPITSADATTAVQVTASPPAGTSIVVDDIIVSTDTAMNVKFRRASDDVVVLGPYYLPANSTLQITTRGKGKTLPADEELEVIASVAGNISVDVGYHTVS